MRLLIAQTNPTPGDFEGNCNQILEGTNRAHENQCQLAVFGELCIPGYNSRDLVYRKGSESSFIDMNLQHLQLLVDASKGMASVNPRSPLYIPSESKLPYFVVGYFDKSRVGHGKPFRNMTAVIHNGMIVATYQKHLLPFYDVFDEARYCEAGTELTVINIGGIRFGIATCEDLWNDKDQDDYNYTDNPLEKYRKIGINNIISTNSSPWYEGKPQIRADMLRKSFQRGVGIYVNHIGGQDELVFDGHSMVVMDGLLIHQSPTSIDSTYEVVEIGPQERPKFKVLDDDSLLLKMMVMGSRDYGKKSGFTDINFGSSGGIDSAVVCGINCLAYGADHVHGIRMPSPNNSAESSDLALAMHKNFGCWDYVREIEYESILKRNRECWQTSDDPKNIVKRITDTGKYNKVSEENIQARLRGLDLMDFSNAYGTLLKTTGNKSELAVGYCTLYGDMNGGYADINDCWKTDVRRLARAINQHYGHEMIPERIITRPPSAELAPGQTDENSLMDYEILDPILKAYVEEYIGDYTLFKEHIRNNKKDAWYARFYSKVNSWFQTPDAQKQHVRMIRLTDMAEFKRRQSAPGIKKSKVAFGTGRRLPIVKKMWYPTV